MGDREWMSRILERSRRLDPPDDAVRAITIADLILLKLYAGGPQNLLDARLLLAAATTDSTSRIRGDVENRLTALPAQARVLWESLR